MTDATMIDGKYCYEYPRPAVTVDAVLFSQREKKQHVLLIRRLRPPFVGMWALPGGFINIDEPLNVAALRELHEETAIVGTKLIQIGAFGAPGRDPRHRTIGIAFLVTEFTGEAHGGDDAADATWWPLDSLPPLAFDHAEIIAAALAR